MATRFNAFISYRHSPLDSQIAQRIHRQLERFRIPKAIQKVTGIKKIDRIFRDKEELPLSVNLSDDINEALVNSDYLIVICSPRFQQSQWCMREIDLFLQTHPVERILIVLAEGEPDDVVPPILTRNREPLCCDYRMKPRKAKSIELPRLVSVLLGCRYDELRQRQRQYKMRRTVAAFSAALAASLCLTAYFIRTSIQIQKANDELHAANVQIQAANVQIQSNLDEALRNQSQYLASASEERMKAGDRLTAIALALEALPGEGETRPYVAEAEQALSDALNAYQSSEKVSAQGAYAADTVVEEFALTQDGDRVYVRDARNIVTVWEASTFQKLHTIDASRYDIQEMYLTPQGNMIFRLNLTGSQMVCVGLDGRELWQVDAGQDVAFLDARSVAIILQHDYLQKHRLLFLNPDTGSQVRDPLPLEKGDDGSYATMFLQQEYQTGQPMVLKYFSSAQNHVVLLDPETAATRFLKTIDTSYNGAQQWIDAVGVIQDDNVVVMCGDGSGSYNGSYNATEVTGMDRADVWCFDGKTGQQLWQTELVTYLYTFSSVVQPIPESNWVLVQNGNTFLVCDSRTGEQIAQCQTATLPLSVNVTSQNTTGILENGDYYAFNYENNNCAANSFIDGTVDMAASNRGFFVHTPLSTQITAYWTDKDENGVRIDCELAYSTRYHALAGDKLAIKTYDALFMLDAARQKLLWQCEAGAAWEIMGFGADGSEFWMWNRNDAYAAAISAADGTRRELKMPAALGEAYTSMDSNLYMAGDQVLYLLECEGALHLLRVDLQSGQTILDLPLDALVPEKTVLSANSSILLATDAYAWVYRDEGVLFVIDLASGNVKRLAEGLTQAPPVAFSADRSQVMTGIGNELRLTTPGGALVCQVDLQDRKAVSMYFYNQQLLVLADDGSLYRYDRKGNLLSLTALNIFDTFTTGLSGVQDDPMNLAWWVTEDGDLILNALRAGNIVDCESWQARAYVPYLCTYVPCNDTLLCLVDKYLYAYPRYTTGQQMEKGLEALGNFRLTEEVRRYYGLSEE